MKYAFVFASAVALLIVPAIVGADSASVREEQVKFTRGYVAALQSNDPGAVLKFMHPSVRACMNDKNRAFFDFVVAQQLKGFPHGNYSHLTITPVKPKSEPMLWSFVPEKEFPYPVKPTHQIQIDYTSDPNGLFTDIIEVAPSGESWYFVTACPNADGMALIRKMQAQGAAQKAKAKKLAAQLHGPLLEKIKSLLAKHDRFGAIEAYKKSTGTDETTAVTVIDALENPNE